MYHMDLTHVAELILLPELLNLFLLSPLHLTGWERRGYLSSQVSNMSVLQSFKMSHVHQVVIKIVQS